MKLTIAEAYDYRRAMMDDMRNYYFCVKAVMLLDIDCYGDQPKLTFALPGTVFDERGKCVAAPVVEQALDPFDYVPEADQRGNAKVTDEVAYMMPDNFDFGPARIYVTLGYQMPPHMMAWCRP